MLPPPPRAEKSTMHSRKRHIWWYRLYAVHACVDGTQCAYARRVSRGASGRGRDRAKLSWSGVERELPTPRIGTAMHVCVSRVAGYGDITHVCPLLFGLTSNPPEKNRPRD